jgi:hypothetical protein
MPSDDKMMTPRKFWFRALSGGLLAQFDWLASTLMVTPNTNPPPSADSDKRK